LSALPAPPPGLLAELPLFPLQTVLFPDGLLQLRVFEARYLDLVSHCLRHDTPFGVVCIHQGSELRRGADKPRFESVGVLAHLREVDAEQPGILSASCRGGLRFEIQRRWQRQDGLWLAEAQAIATEPGQPVPAELEPAARALEQAIASLAAQDQHPFAPPFRLADAGWVANRWCEILPVSLAAKQRLMALDEPVLRLKLVDEYLRGKGVL
jgi:hypothetical protein